MERIQTLMNEVYEYWNQKGEELSKNQVLEKFPTSRGIAVRFGNFNYQVHNGGTAQWIYNGYMEDDIGHLLSYCEQGVEAGIKGFDDYLALFRQAFEDMVDYEEDTEEECCICDGYGEMEYDNIEDVPYPDEDIEELIEKHGSVTLSCDECGGTGKIDIENPLPESVDKLEKHLYDKGQDALFEIVEALLDVQLEKEKTEK